MLSADSSCKREFSNHNYTVMFGNEGNWGDIKVWNQHVTLYLARQEARQIEDEVYLCIQFKEQWEPAWKGNYNLPIAHKNFFCNKDNNSSKWECIGCEIRRNERKDIDSLIRKYNKQATPNKSFNTDRFIRRFASLHSV